MTSANEAVFREVVHANTVSVEAAQAAVRRRVRHGEDLYEPNPGRISLRGIHDEDCHALFG